MRSDHSNIFERINRIASTARQEADQDYSIAKELKQIKFNTEVEEEDEALKKLTDRRRKGNRNR